MSKYLSTEEVEKKAREHNPGLPINPAIARLNEKQRDSALAKEQNILILAGAGTGKTQVMITRIANLIANGVTAKRILALSFTNESANELGDRIVLQSGYDGTKVQVGTFHAICNTLLRYNKAHSFFKDKMGYSEGFFIIDNDESNQLMDQSIKELSPEIRAIMKSIEMNKRSIFKELTFHRANCKNASAASRELLSNEKDYKLNLWRSFVSLGADVTPGNEEQITTAVRGKLQEFPFLKDMLTINVWAIYSKMCKANHAIDFDDVLLNAYYLLHFNEDIRNNFSNQFDHLAVDEFQDANNIQMALLKELVRGNPSLNLSVIGDPKQSIYGFREAKVENILNISELMRIPFNTYELDYNYRSTSRLIDITNCFAKDMINQLTTGQLKAGNDSIKNIASEIKLNRFKTAEQEANFVVDKTRELIDSGTSPTDIYILYRSRLATKVLVPLLTQYDVPHEMIGEANFYERAEVRDSMAFLRSMLREKDILAWARMIDCAKLGVSGTWLRSASKEKPHLTPRDLLFSRINNKNSSRINEFMDFFDAAKDYLNDPKHLATYTEQNYKNQSTAAVENLIESDPEFKKNYMDWVERDSEEYMEAITLSWNDFVIPTYTKSDIAANKKKEDINPAEITAKRSESIVNIFKEVCKRMARGDLFTNIVEDLMLRDTPTRKDRAGTVKLMTGHAAKGLQAAHVFMIGNDEAIWNPSKKDDADGEDGRLYYVMITRAEQHLYLTSAEGRTINGEWTNSPPSTKLVDHVNLIQEAHSDKLTITDPTGSFIETNIAPETVREQKTDRPKHNPAMEKVLAQVVLNKKESDQHYAPSLSPISLN